MPQQQTGQVEISLDYQRHLGGKFVHGGVRLRFDSTKQYCFTSEASWPNSEKYEDAIRTSVEEVLTEKLGGLTCTSVVLLGVTWDVINSCESGFRLAARAATLSAFSV
jgi:hypothetical protein